MPVPSVQNRARLGEEVICSRVAGEVPAGSRYRSPTGGYRRLQLRRKSGRVEEGSLQFIREKSWECVSVSRKEVWMRKGL